MTAPNATHCYPNRFARLLIQTMQTELGTYSTESLLANAGLPGDLPEDNLERSYPFSQLAALNRALYTLYGAQGGRGLALDVGRAWFIPLASYGAFAAFGDPAFQRLPLNTRLTIGLKVLAEVFSRSSDQITSVDQGTSSPLLIVTNSPFVYDEANTPVCHLLVGVAQGCLSAASSGLTIPIREIECRAAGDERCVFAVHTEAPR